VAFGEGGATGWREVPEPIILNAGDDSRVLLNQLPLHPDPAIRTWVVVT
jgi:hypothetical protein